MKQLLVCSGLLLATAVYAQKTPASPKANATAEIGGHAITVTYSSPAVKGREGKLFGKDGRISHDPHYPVWRAGANSATTLHLEGDIRIGDLSVPQGDYTLFVDISDPDQWTLIVNKKTGEWGLAYDGSADLGKAKMHMAKPSPMVENLLYTIKDNGGGKGTITLAWEDHEASVSVAAAK